MATFQGELFNFWGVSIAVVCLRGPWILGHSFASQSISSFARVFCWWIRILFEQGCLPEGMTSVQVGYTEKLPPERKIPRSSTSPLYIYIFSWGPNLNRTPRVWIFCPEKPTKNKNKLGAAIRHPNGTSRYIVQIFDIHLCLMNASLVFQRCNARKDEQRDHALAAKDSQVRFLRDW